MEWWAKQQNNHWNNLYLNFFLHLLFVQKRKFNENFSWTLSSFRFSSFSPAHIFCVTLFLFPFNIQSSYRNRQLQYFLCTRFEDDWNCLLCFVSQFIFFSFVCLFLHLLLLFRKSSMTNGNDRFPNSIYILYSYSSVSLLTYFMCLVYKFCLFFSIRNVTKEKPVLLISSSDADWLNLFTFESIVTWEFGFLVRNYIDWMFSGKMF